MVELVRMLTSYPDSMRLFRLWEAGETPDDICHALGISYARLRQLAKRYKLRGAEKLRTHYEVEPTEGEIAAAVAKLKSRWSPAEASRRRPGANKQAGVKSYRLGKKLTVTALDS